MSNEEILASIAMNLARIASTLEMIKDELHNIGGDIEEIKEHLQSSP